MNAERHWKSALGQLQMEMSRAAFDTWVRDAEFIAYEDGAFVIGVQNAYARDWLEDRLLSTVKRVLNGIMGRSVEVRFVIWQTDASPERPVPALEGAGDPEDNRHKEAYPDVASQLNARYAFKSFVVGACNRLAHAAAQAVAESPAQAYNPLFLYGGVGLGKTHLLHAIGNASVGAELRVLYVSSEDFTNDLVNAIRSHTTEAFRERYRRIDVLLIDDIQFIAGKESTQEEFFHTFNTLHGQDRQVVISSDRPARALVTLEERLRSRFQWGLTVDIQPPDFETRLAILRSKAERTGRHVPPEFLEIIARRIQSNIRELEGGLTRVLAFSDLSGVSLTAELVEAALDEFLPRRSKPEVDRVISTVAHNFGLEVDRMLGPARNREVSLPRQIAMYLLREETNASLPQIGDALGGRDHTTVMYGCDKIADLLETDDSLRRRVLSLRQALYQRRSALATTGFQTSS